MGPTTPDSTGNPFVDFYLAHYGVKGMKWGVTRRRSAKPGPAGEVAMLVKSQTSSAAPKHVKQMTNEELADHIRRLQMEKQYKDLKRGDLSPGAQFAQRVFDQTASGLASDILRESGKALIMPYTADRIAKRTGYKQKESKKDSN